MTGARVGKGHPLKHRVLDLASGAIQRKFHVHFDLPGVDPDSISLTVEQNVLTLTIPVREAAKPRNIQTTSSDRRQAATAERGGRQPGASCLPSTCPW